MERQNYFIKFRRKNYIPETETEIVSATSPQEAIRQWEKNRAHGGDPRGEYALRDHDILEIKEI